MNVARVSVVICTHNRADLLRETLASVDQMTPPRDCVVEIVVVDNNSNDETPAVVAEAQRRSRFHIVSLKEPRQGKSFALNLALSKATGDVLALTDDDVLPARDWLVRIVRAFREREVTFVFGKVLPRWSRVPPPKLLTRKAQAIWGPLAIVDYGDTPTVYDPDAPGQRLPIGANLAFSRAALLTVGGWRTDLGKFNNSLLSGEDHEIFLRLRRFGLYAGFYDPDVSVRHYVPRERLTRRYFRRWFYWHGKTQALMLDDLYAELDMARVPRIAGIPRFAIRQGVEQAWRWLRSLAARDSVASFVEELKLLEYAGLFVHCWQLSRRRVTTKSTSCGAGLADETVSP